jgi:hypothetical protein
VDAEAGISCVIYGAKSTEDRRGSIPEQAARMPRGDRRRSAKAVCRRILTGGRCRYLRLFRISKYAG